MEVVFEGSFKAFREISIIAFRWLKDTHRLTQEQGIKVEKNRKSTQDNKQSIKNNVTEIFCIRARHEVHKDKIGRLEILVRNQEKALISQERKLEELGEGSKKKGRNTGPEWPGGHTVSANLPGIPCLVHHHSLTELQSVLGATEGAGVQ